MPPSGKPDGPTLEQLVKAIAEQGETLKQLAAKLDALEARVGNEALKSAMVSGQADTLGDIAKTHQEMFTAADKQFRDFAKQTSDVVLSIQRRLPQPPKPKPDPLIH